LQTHKYLLPSRNCTGAEQLHLSTEEVHAVPWRPATQLIQLGDTSGRANGLAVGTWCSWKNVATKDVGVNALQLGHHIAQQLQMHKR